MDTQGKAELSRQGNLNWSNLRGLVFLHVLAAVAVWYLADVQFHWATIALAFVWYGLTGLSITAGYHRAFTHRAFEVSAVIRWFFLIFGAGALQGSLLQWSVDHRNHHRFSDQEGDPYGVRNGFWWAHVGWLLRNRHGYEDPHLDNVKDLVDLPGVKFQHKFCDVLGFSVAFLVAAGLASLWGDFWGGFLVAGALRAVLLLHATWCVNSVAHWFGSRPYSKIGSARNNVLTALITGGEGYHNFHHRFPSDYRNGIRWYQYDPTKWFIWSLHKLGLATDLKRTQENRIRSADEV